MKFHRTMQSIQNKAIQCNVERPLHFNPIFTNLTKHRQTCPWYENQTNMKSQPQPIMRFSGYPLRLVEKKAVKLDLKPIRPTAGDQTTLIQKNNISNDPVNWDVAWFNGYE